MRFKRLRAESRQPMGRVWFVSFKNIVLYMKSFGMVLSFGNKLYVTWALKCGVGKQLLHPKALSKRSHLQEAYALSLTHGHCMGFICVSHISQENEWSYIISLHFHHHLWYLEALQCLCITLVYLFRILWFVLSNK